MKKYLLTILAVIIPFVVVGCLRAAHAEWSIIEMNKQIDQTNFLVNKGCSGTLIDLKNNYILTANHCIKDQYETIEHDNIDDDGVVKKEKIRVAKPGTVSQIFFAGPNEVQRIVYVFKIELTDNDLDLALLKVQTKLHHKMFAKIACAEPARGRKVFAVGNSFGILYSTLTTGIVSGTRSYRDLHIAGELGDLTDNGEHGLIQHSAQIAPGNSGGALYDNDGNLAGVNVRGAPGGFAFAVPLPDIKKFLRREGLNRLWTYCKPKKD